MDKYIENSLDISKILSLAYTILNDYNMPVGLQYNIEGVKDGKKIHVMMEVVENDN